MPTDDAILQRYVEASEARRAAIDDGHLSLVDYRLIEENWIIAAQEYIDDLVGNGESAPDGLATEVAAKRDQLDRDTAV